MSAQRKAAIWHWADLGLAVAVIGWAVLGTWGHYKLRREYHEASRAVALRIPA